MLGDVCHFCGLLERLSMRLLVVRCRWVSVFDQVLCDGCAEDKFCKLHYLFGRHPRFGSGFNSLDMRLECGSSRKRQMGIVPATLRLAQLIDRPGWVAGWMLG